MKKFLALLLSTMMVLGMAGTFASAEETGSVYYLNFKPEAEEAWQALAKTYTELTGVPVTVVTAASGTYSETLTVEMDKGASAPTLFQCGNQQGLDTWGDYCLDLRDTDFYKELTTEEFNLFGDNGEAFAVGYCYEAFGIIVNKKLINENVDYRKRITTEKMRADMAEEKAAELDNKVKVGSVLRARDIRLSALNDRSKPVSRVKNAARLRVDFALAANELATPGNKAVYVRITSPDGYVLTTEAMPTFEFEGERLSYSAMREVDYQNQDLEVGIYYNSTGFAAGTYQIQLYCEGRLIGQTQVVMK